MESPDPYELAEPVAPGPQLDWSPTPGAFEQALRRRFSNPLFDAERQVVRRSELKAAKIRDAADARSILSDFVELSLDRHKLARLDTVEEIDLALVRYQTMLQTVMGVGGAVPPLVTALNISRTSLIERWRVAHRDHPEILAALDKVLESDTLDDPASHNEFAAQLLRENSPIRPSELAAALLSEPRDTIEIVLATFTPEQRSEIRIEALALIFNLQSLGVEIEDQQAKVDLMLATQ